MKRTIRTSFMIIGIMMAGAGAAATEFWEHYADYITYNYVVKAGAVPEVGINQRLTSHEVLSVATKSFSQSFGIRIAEVAKDHRALLLVCMFSSEPERCYVDNVIQTTFDEIKLLKAPGFSQRFIKKFGKYYTTSFAKPKSVKGVASRAENTPRWKVFNPKYGFALNDMEFMVVSPFYSFYNIYVEPGWGSVHGASLSLMKNRLAINVDREGASLGIFCRHKFRLLKEFKLTIHPEGEFMIDNVFIMW
ncbi:MAG TPA: hypothetical protein PLN69_08580 [bacterium]|nr:hypothetical protein [bacterium]